MRTNRQLILSILLYTVFYQEVSTLPDPDTSCESESCWNLDPLSGTLYDQFKNFPGGGEDWKLDLPPQAPPVMDPDVEIQIMTPQLQPDECKVYNTADSSLSSEEDNSGSGATNIRQCEQAVTTDFANGL